MTYNPIIRPIDQLRAQRSVTSMVSLFSTWSQLMPAALDLIQLPTASSKFPNKTHMHTVLDLFHLPLAISEFPGARSASPRASAVLANSPPHDHPECIRMPHAKFRADPLKTMGEHKEQRNRQTQRQTPSQRQIQVLYIHDCTAANILCIFH